MNAYRRNPCTPTSSLTAEIGEVERRLRRRQRLVQVRTATLGQTLRRRMTAPVTLIWTGAIGFLIGEATRRPMPDPEPTQTDRPKESGRPFFETVLDLIRFATWMHALFPGESEVQCGPTTSTGSEEETTHPETQRCDANNGDTNDREQTLG